MKKFKALILGLTMVCAVGMFAACGKVPEVTEDDVLDALEEEGFITDDMDEDSYSVKIEETDLNDDEDRADVTCILTVTSGYVKYETEIELKFKLKDDKESWKYRDKYETKETKESLAKGIDEEDLDDELSWESIVIDDNYFYFGDDITDYEVTEQETDLEEKTDVITIEGKAEDGFTTYEFTAELTFTYDYGWYLTESEVTECETTYAEGYETEIDADTLTADLIDDGEYVWANGYYFYFDECEVSDVTVNEIDRDGYYAYVSGTATLTENGTSVTADVDVEYYFDDYDMEWEYNWFNDYEVTAYASDLFGTYSGTDANGTTHTLTIKDEKNDDDYYYVEVSITTATETYSYSAYVSYFEPDDGYVSIYSDEWIVQPADAGAYMDSYYGYIVDGTFTEDWGDLTLTKQQ